MTSFITELDNIPKQSNRIHVPQKVRKITAEKGQLKDKIILPPQCFFTGIQRQKPASSFSTQGLFSVGQSLDFYCDFTGYNETIRLELDMQINPLAANPVVLNSNYLINRFEWYTSDNNIAQTWYADQVWLRRLHWGSDKSRYENNASGINPITYGPTSHAAGEKFTVEIEVPSFISDCNLKGGVFNNRLLCRVWFDNIGVISGSSTDLWCNLADLIFYNDQLSPELEQLEISKKKSENLMYRCLDPVRCATFTISNATANQQYDVMLTSANQLSAFMFFIVRTSPLTSANIQSYVSGLTWELYNSSMSLIATTMSDNRTKYILGQKFGGDILNNTAGNGIYIIPFSTDINKSLSGNNMGFYANSTREVLRLYFPSTFVQSNVIVEVYSMNMAAVEIDKSILKYYK